MKIKFPNLFIFFLIALSYGCVKPRPTQPPIDFQFVTINKEDTFSSLAKQYTSLVWQIKEFNGSYQLKAGQELIIPLKPFRPGGLSAHGHQLIPVLSYHNFSNSRSGNKMTVSANVFRKQLSYLQQNNFHVITMDQLLEFINFGQIPKKSVLITIDDGWRTSYEIAYPILKEYGFNATLFIPTKFIESKHPLALTWNQLRQIVSDDTIDIQCHTKSHRDLGTIKNNESFLDYITAIEEDISHSTNTIYTKLGKQVSSLAYPFGSSNALVMAIVNKHGYKTAFTVKRKGNPFYKQPLLLNRAMVFGTFRLSRFAKNIKHFEEYKITEPEPIDTLYSLASIAKNNPQQYEDRKQWRTAHLAWKLRRDKLISQKQKIEATITNAELLTLNQSIQKAEQKVKQLNSKLNDIAKNYFLEALTKIQTGKKVKRLLLLSLLYNPENKSPLDLFQTDMGKLKPLLYQVKENDSFRSIANQLYQDPKKSILIPLFNKEVKGNSDLFAGMKLLLPSLPTIKVPPEKRPQCNVLLTKDRKQSAIDYYHKANENFEHDQIIRAIKNLKTAICLNPKHSKAIEMLEMLKDI